MENSLAFFLGEVKHCNLPKRFVDFLWILSLGFGIQSVATVLEEVSPVKKSRFATDFGLFIGEEVRLTG